MIDEDTLAGAQVWLEEHDAPELPDDVLGRAATVVVNSDAWQPDQT